MTPPEVVPGAVAVISGRDVFVVTSDEAGDWMTCRNCEGRARLVGGEVDARQLEHLAGCVIGAAIAEAGDKPVILRSSKLQSRH
jgi:hypothetical protein